MIEEGEEGVADGKVEQPIMNGHPHISNQSEEVYDHVMILARCHL
jgi:hypothetical protein